MDNRLLFYLPLLCAGQLYVGPTPAPHQDGTRRIYFTNGNTEGTVDADFCAEDGDGNCQWPQYAESVLLVGGIAGLLIAIIFLLLMPCFYVGRGFRLFGGKRPSHGCFLAGDDFDKDQGEGYTTKSVWILKPFVLLGFIVLVVVSAIGFEGNNRFNTALDDFLLQVNETAELIVADAKEALDALEPLLVQAETLNLTLGTDISQYSALIDEAAALVDEAGTFVVQLSDAELIRWRLVTAAYSISIIMYFFLLLASCVNGHRIATFTALFAWVAVILAWLSFSFSNPLSVVLTDFCFVLDDIGNLSFVPTQVKDLITCDANTFGSLNTVQANLFQVQAQICNQVDTVCGSSDLCNQTTAYNGSFGCRVFTCASPCTPDEIGALSTALAGVTVLDMRLGCLQHGSNVVDPSTCGSITSFDQRCSWVDPTNVTRLIPPVPCQPFVNRSWDTCVVQTRCFQENPIRADLLLIQDYVNLINGFQAFIDEFVTPLLSCRPINEVWNSSKVFICVDVQPAVTEMYLGSLLVGISWVFGLFFSVLGVKRFNKSYRRPKRTDVEPTGIFKTMRKAQKTLGHKTGLQKARTKMNLGAHPSGRLPPQHEAWTPSESQSQSQSSLDQYQRQDDSDRTPTPGTPPSDDFQSGSAYSASE